MATEPAWAALFSIMFLAEPMTWRMAVGGGLMLAAMIIVESPTQHRSVDVEGDASTLPG